LFGALTTLSGCGSDSPAPNASKGTRDSGAARDAASSPSPEAGKLPATDASPPRSTRDASITHGGVSDAEADVSSVKPPNMADGGADAAPSGSVDAASDAGIDVAPSPVFSLAGSAPFSGQADVPATTWILLTFTPSLPPRITETVHFDCGNGTPQIDVDAVGTTLVINPRAPLAPNAECTASFTLNGKPAHVVFTVAPAGPPAVIAYDRNDSAAFDPFPDDYYLVADPSTRTGLRVDIRTPTVEGAITSLLEAAITPTRGLDGMSPLAPIVVSLPAALPADVLPHTAADSLDPFATAGLFDIDPASPAHGQRVPFDLFQRDKPNADGTPAHVLVVFPSIPLRPRGHYAFVVTNRAVVDPTRPLQASDFFEKVAAKLSVTDDEKRLEPYLTRVLTELAGVTPALHVDDLAIALGITVRSVDDIPADLSSIREQIEAAPPPAFTITSATADTTAGSNVAAIVKGTWSPLSFTTDSTFLARDANGKPQAGKTVQVPFTLALPKRPSGGPAPIIVYQAGEPGSPEEEVPDFARAGLAQAGFAVLGFTDIVNRDVIPDGDPDGGELTSDVLFTLLASRQLPDYLNVLDQADQLSFLRMIPTLASLDVLPLAAPDGVSDLDPSRPLGYLGAASGSTQGTGLLAFAPEIHAAALVAGAGRFSANLFSADDDGLYAGVSQYFPTYTRAQSYGGLALLQMAFDHQDSENLAAFTYRAQNAPTAGPHASILMVEGIGDIYAPFFETRCGAAALGIPLLKPAVEDVPFLGSIGAPAQANIDATTTAAFVQFAVIASGGANSACTKEGLTDERDCAFRGTAAVGQRASFFTSALGGVPTIPFAN
jgi:hypothetical protein